jgi:hypothetical protein
MNTAGQIGAFLSPIVLPYLVGGRSRPEDWALPLYIAAGLYLAGSLCWLFIDPSRCIRLEAQAAVDPAEMNGRP